MRSLVLAAALAACGHAAAQEPARPSPMPMASDPTCPLIVPGTSVTVEDTSDGAALVFVTTGDVAEVRKRTMALANLHDQQHGKAGGTVDIDNAAPVDHTVMRDTPPPTTNHDLGLTPMGAMISSPSTTAVTNVDGGARIVFTAKPDDVVKLQQELRMHANHLTAGSCKMAM